jgi:hypothetical protein
MYYNKVCRLRRYTEKKPCTEIRNAKRIVNESHHLLIPGTPSLSPSPPEYRFAGFTGELFTNVGPLEAGLANAGVEVLFDLTHQPNRRNHHT